jgi:hypothetical protein
MKYGLDKIDLKFCRDKIDAQKSYLSNNFFNTSTGQVKSLLDVSFSANISERYYAQLSNKINTMSDLAKSQNLKPVFLTITLDGFFRGFLRGDYAKWDKQRELQKLEYFRHIPNNETYGFLRDKIKDRAKFTIKDCYNVLAFQWYRYASGYAFKSVKKEGKKFIYLKAAEPHKDGVPHFHVLLWIPQNYFESFKKDFERYFPAPQNHKLITDGNEGDTKGFQTAIHNPVGYIMKYATKSFMDLRIGEDLNYLQSWYIKHKIRRITTSHSTIPQWVYQKVFALEKDWYHLTDIVAREPMLCEWNREENYFCLIEDNGRVLEYDNGLLTLRYLGSDRPIQQLGEKKERLEPVTQIKKIPISLKPKNEGFVPVYIDGYRYNWDVYHKELIKTIFNDKFAPVPLKMKDAQLMSYYQSLDLQTVHYAHYLHVREVCIERGLIRGELRSKDTLYDPEVAEYYFNYNWGSENVF